MSRHILKWEVPIDDEWHDIGGGPVVLVGVQHTKLYVWTDEFGNHSPVKARVFGTGQPLPEGLRHVGSVISGFFVWHVLTAVNLRNEQ